MLKQPVLILSVLPLFAQLFNFQSHYVNISPYLESRPLQIEGCKKGQKYALQITAQHLSFCGLSLFQKQQHQYFLVWDHTKPVPTTYSLVNHLSNNHLKKLSPTSKPIPNLFLLPRDQSDE